MSIRDDICQVVRDDISYSISSTLKGHSELVRAVNRTGKYRSMYEIPLQGVKEAARQHGIYIASPDADQVKGLLDGDRNKGYAEDTRPEKMETATPVEYEESPAEDDPLQSEELLEFGLDAVSTVWTWLEKGPEYWGNMRELEEAIDGRGGEIESESEAYQVVLDSFGSMEDYLDQTEEFLTAGRDILDLRDVMDVLEQQLPDSLKAKILQKTASAADNLLVKAYDREIDRIQQVREEYRAGQEEGHGV